MRTENPVGCPVCQEPARVFLHVGLKDRLQGVPGSWGYAECFACRLIYLDPAPTPEDLHLAYASYPTHGSGELPKTVLRRARGYVREGYLSLAFGYKASAQKRLAGLLAYLHPGQRAYMGGSVAWLPGSRRGRVLDVGAGAGAKIRTLTALGWDAEGVEPDSNATSVISGLARAGLLEEQGYASDSFDALVLDHVIEHVHDPVNLLSECRRILRPGGMLVVATPNSGSIGRFLFKDRWRVFEPPRHLTVFSRETLETAAAMAEFPKAQVKSGVRGADGVFTESLDSTGRASKILGQLYQYAMSAATLIRPDVGEELVMRAIK